MVRRPRAVDAETLAAWCGDLSERARSEGNLALQATAVMLDDAGQRVPEGLLASTVVEAHDQAWTVWVDAARGVVLATVPQTAASD